MVSIRIVHIASTHLIHENILRKNPSSTLVTPTSLKTGATKRTASRLTSSGISIK